MEWLWIVFGILLLPFVLLVVSWLLFLLYLLITPRFVTLKYNDKYIGFALNVLGFLLKKTYRIKYKLINKEILPDSHFVLISNHRHLVDPIVLMMELSKQRLAGISKKEVFNIKPILPWLHGIRVLPLDRSNDREGVKTMIKAIKQAKEGQPMFIFPEGTRSREEGLLPFKDGAMKLAIKSKVDVYISVLHNFNKHRWAHIKNEHLAIEFVGPITHEEYKDLSSQELSDKIKTIMEERIDKYENR